MIAHSQPLLTPHDQAAMHKVLATGMIAEGELTAAFQDRLAAYLGMPGGVAAASGTDALFLALKALDVGAGDEVILPSYVCRAVWDAVRQAGAVPVLCDAGEDWCVQAQTIRPCITGRTKAVIVAHLFGIVADMPPILQLGLPIIEDCCQALGAAGPDGRRAGTMGDVCVLSFHATKLLTTGEGGMALTDDKHLLDKLRRLKQGTAEGLSERFRHPLSDMQAALGLSQLDQYPGFLERRRNLAHTYFQELASLPIALPAAVRDRSIFFRFPLRHGGDFEQTRQRFERHGVHVRQGVDALLHSQAGIPSGAFSMTERLFKETLSIPIYPALSDDACRRVIDACRAVLAEAT